MHVSFFEKEKKNESEKYAARAVGLNTKKIVAGLVVRLPAKERASCDVNVGREEANSKW